MRMLTFGGRGWALAAIFAVTSSTISLSALPFFGAAPALAQAGVIRDIAVAGNKRVEPETVRSYLKFSTGDAYDAAKVDASIRSLFATGLFADVSINRTASGVVVTVRENPVVNQVAFEGNREVEKATLEAEVQMKSRAVYTRSKVQADVQRILDVYRRQGRFAAKVEPKLIEIDNNRVNVVFEINEGAATKVKSISFTGNRAFSDSQLRDIITTSQSGLFDFLKGTNIYDPDRVSLDKELLRQYYMKNGYADARITGGTAELDRDGSGFFINFVIEEGPLYRFGAVNIESKLPSVNTGALQRELLTKSGAYFDATAMEKTTEKLTLLVAEQGYSFGRVRPQAVRDPGGQAINVTYLVDEGPRVYIERININGNLRTQDYVIRREFRLAEGDAFNPLMVDRAKKRLQALGFFKAVDIKRRPGNAPDRVVLDVDLVEQSTGELSFGAGYSTSEGVIGDVSLTERNLLGRGQFVRLKLAGSLERMQVDFSFTEPRFLDRNLAAGFDIFYKGTQRSSSQPYATKKIGGAVRLGFALAENLWMNTSYSLSHDTISDVQSTASRAIKQACNWDNATGTCTDGKSLTSAVGVNLTYDQRNHPTTPNRGFFLSAGVDFAGLGGDVQYVRGSAEARGYYPITEKITLVGRMIGGHIQGWGGEDVRLLDLFYKGGETVRGFKPSGIGPRDTFTGDAVGGQTYWAATAEVRFPLPLVPDELGMSGAVFADAGSLFGASGFAKGLNDCTKTSATNICLKDEGSIRSSVGASLLWNSPLGPLRLDFAKALTKEVYDKTQIFRFGASTKF